jgi:aminotransferase
MVEKYLEKRISTVERPNYLRLPTIASKMDGIINLCPGDPDFETPKFIRDAAIKALNEGWTHYPPTPGRGDLREALAEYHSKYGVDWKPSEAIVTAGSGLALYLSVAGTVNPGEEVIVLEPYYMVYPLIINYLGAKMVPVPSNQEKGFHIDIEKLRESVTPKTKMIMLCTPNNPSGTVLTKEELLEVADLAQQKDLLVLSDEVYNEFIWDGREHISIASLPGMKERTIVCNSFSKTWAMTGWRLGYILTDERLATRITRMPLGYRPSTFVQRAGLAALKGPWEPVEKMMKEYDSRRRYFASRLDDIDGIECPMPEGGFYVFPDIKAFGNSEEFCETLLKEQKILVYSGTAFGENTDGYMRIPLVKPKETLEKVADAIEEHAKKMR